MVSDRCGVAQFVYVNAAGQRMVTEGTRLCSSQKGHKGCHSYEHRLEPPKEEIYRRALVRIWYILKKTDGSGKHCRGCLQNFGDDPTCVAQIAGEVLGKVPTLTRKAIKQYEKRVGKNTP